MVSAIRYQVHYHHGPNQQIVETHSTYDLERARQWEREVPHLGWYASAWTLRPDDTAVQGLHAPEDLPAK